MTYLAPEHDHPFTGEMPSPDFSEAQMWNFTDGQFGLIYHLGAMPGGLRLWHNAFALTCPDGSVLATKVVGPGMAGRFGTHIAHTETLEPYRAWRITFDGGLRRFDPANLWASPGTDGRHIPAKVTLEVSATHPVWEPGVRTGDEDRSLFRTIYHMHHEQALTAKGLIEIDGTRLPFQGVGHRDHSFGPRDITKVLTGHWINGTFDSGWAFLAMDGEMESTGHWDRAAVFEDGRVVEARFEHDGHLSSPRPDPLDFCLRLVTDERVRDIQVHCRPGVNWFGAGPSEFCLGANLSDPTSYNWHMCFAELECDGEHGLGLVDRGAQASRMKPA